MRENSGDIIISNKINIKKKNRPMLNIERINKDLTILYEFNYSIFLLKITRGRKEELLVIKFYIKIKKEEM